jgi:hypothetical protein
MVTARTIFSLLRQASYSQDSFSVSASSIRILMNSADTFILKFLFHDELDDISPGARRLSTLLLAAHVFLYIALREVPTKSAIMKILRGRLEKVLSNIDSDLETWKMHLPALLWVTFIGAAAAKGAAKCEEDGLQQMLASRFETALFRMTERHNVASLGDVEHALRMFLWKDKFCGPALNEMWMSGGDVKGTGHASSIISRLGTESS